MDHGSKVTASPPGRDGRRRRAGVLPLALALLACLPAPTRAQAPATTGEAAPARPDRSERTPLSIRWGPERLGLIRYNRVEGLSVGARAAALPTWFGAPVRVALTARLGTSGPTPGALLEFERVTLRSGVGVAAFSEVAAVDAALDPLGPFASLAAVLGRDDGDYFRRSGAALWWASPPGSAFHYRLSAYSVRHDALTTSTRLALPRMWNASWRYRPNLVADEGWEHGVEGAARWLLGHDPGRIHGSVEVSTLAATGSADFVRGSGRVRLSVPLPADLRVDLTGSGGASAGAVTVQRLWAVGGPADVRGYAPRARLGGCFWSGRVEVAYTSALGDFVAFSDVGDAVSCRGGQGDAERLGWLPGREALASLGGGLFLVDGVIRISAAWAVDGRASRVDLMVVDRP